MSLSRHVVTSALAALAVLPSACNDNASGASDAAATTPADAAATSSDVDAATVAETIGADTAETSGPVTTTIHDITAGLVGAHIDVRLLGVVAMSQKFLVSKSSSGACLWGAFVSAPGLSETGANTGLLVTSYGTQAAIPEGGTQAYCPKLGGGEAAGDALPDDLAPGDVLDLAGQTTTYLPSTCGQTAGDSSVPQVQLAKVTSATRHGTAPIPTAHVLTEGELGQLMAPSDQVFHDQWGGVKVRVTNLTSLPQANAFTDTYGFFYLGAAGGTLKVGDRVYYRAWLKTQDFCHAAPTEPATTTFAHVEGFVYLDYCSWVLAPNDKCADLNPASSDCQGNAAACAP